jgi:hypothetical protein
MRSTHTHTHRRRGIDHGACGGRRGAVGGGSYQSGWVPLGELPISRAPYSGLGEVTYAEVLGSRWSRGEILCASRRGETGAKPGRP